MQPGVGEPRPIPILEAEHRAGSGQSPAGPSHPTPPRETTPPNVTANDGDHMMEDGMNDTADIEVAQADVEMHHSPSPPPKPRPVPRQHAKRQESPIRPMSPAANVDKGKGRARPKAKVVSPPSSISGASDHPADREARSESPIRPISPVREVRVDKGKGRARPVSPIRAVSPPRLAISVSEDSDEELPTADEIVALTQSRPRAQEKPVLLTKSKSKSKQRVVTPEPAPSSPLSSPTPEPPSPPKTLKKPARPLTKQVSVVIPEHKVDKVQRTTSTTMLPPSSKPGPSRAVGRHRTEPAIPISSPNTLTPRTAKNPYAKYDDDGKIPRTDSDLSSLPAEPSSPLHPAPSSAVPGGRASKRAAAIKGAEGLAASVADMNQFQREMKSSQGDVRRLSFGGAGKRVRDPDNGVSDDDKTTHKSRKVGGGGKQDTRPGTQGKNRPRSNLRQTNSDEDDLESQASDRDTDQAGKPQPAASKSKAQPGLEKGAVGKAG